MHFGYSGQVGPEPSVHYIRMSTKCEVSSIWGVKDNLVTIWHIDYIIIIQMNIGCNAVYIFYLVVEA